MKHDNDNSWLDPMLERHIRHEPANFNFTTWAENHPEEARFLRCGPKGADRNVKRKPSEIWSMIMESKVIRYSAAAMIILTLALVLLSPFGSPGNGGVVLAEVQQKVADTETMVIRGTKTFSYPDEDGKVFEFDGFKGQFDLVKYLSRQHGFIEEGYDKDKLVYRMTFNKPKRQTLIILPPWKKYMTFPSTDQQVQLLEDLTPEGIVNLLMGGDCKELGRDTLDGVEAEVFAFQNREPFKNLLPKPIVDIQDYTGKIWIGVKEQMPLRIEGDLIMGKCFMTMFHELNLHEVNILGEFNVELDEGIFDTSPPEGYTELSLGDILPLIPIEAKAGALGLLAIPAGLIAWKKRSKKRREKVNSC
ncbi:MAG: hypothetical protein JW828_05570 [Sedimentisphaerales bacterium]|nr:hypothetical protein [Sedimentisphaerales bacterium]